MSKLTNAQMSELGFSTFIGCYHTKEALLNSIKKYDEPNKSLALNHAQLGWNTCLTVLNEQGLLRSKPNE